MMKLNIVEHGLSVSCLSCHKENLKPIELQWDNGTGQYINLCPDCREKLIKFLEENREVK